MGEGRLAPRDNWRWEPTFPGWVADEGEGGWRWTVKASMCSICLKWQRKGVTGAGGSAVMTHWQHWAGKGISVSWKDVWVQLGCFYSDQREALPLQWLWDTKWEAGQKFWLQGRSREVTSIQECYDGKGFSRHSLDVRLWAVTWADAQGYGASGDTHTAGKQWEN